MIAAAEGTSNIANCGQYDLGYQGIFGCDRISSRVFSNYSKHPQRSYRTGWGTLSDASGRYQFKSMTWNELAIAHGIRDFSPESQDYGAALKIKQRGSSVASIVDYDTFLRAAKGVNLEWASMPGSPYGQPVKNGRKLYSVYTQALALYN